MLMDVRKTLDSLEAVIFFFVKVNQDGDCWKSVFACNFCGDNLPRK
jgi:hypothetical protein